MADDPKRVAAAILGAVADSEKEGAEESSGEFDADDVALGAVADEMLSAFKADDREALIEALRSLKMCCT